MKKSVLLAAALLALGCAQAQIAPKTASAAAAAAPKPAETPEQLVQRQLEAYNARDVARFAATYAPDVELLQFPNTPQVSGREKMTAMYTQFFASAPKLHCEIVSRTVLGNRVIDHERVTGLPDGKTLEAVAIYEVENGLIRRVTFIR
jgi:uncharacterized protein (TIGR02246 family)